MADEEERGSLPVGALVGGRFQVERLIGRGGMGEVYAARHLTTGKEVALKRIHAAAGVGKDRIRRFLLEARTQTAINHPNVVEVFDVFEDGDGTPVMVMELLKGEPFSALRERLGALDLNQTAEVLLPAIKALRAAHEKNIVHRDLKPDNVFLTTTPSGPVAKLLDFGIAKVLDPTKIRSETQGQHTTTGAVLGTPHYMSFEQAMSDENIDHRTDIWAVGVMLFESLTGRRPLAYETLGQMYATFLQGSVPSIREFVPDLPGDVADLIDRCLAKEKEDRLDDLGPLIEVLSKYCDPDVPGAHAGGRRVLTPVPAAFAVTRSLHGRRTVWTAVLLGFLAVGGVGALAVTRRVLVAADTGRDAGSLSPPPPPPAAASSASAPSTEATVVPGPSPTEPPPPPTASTAGGVRSHRRDTGAPRPPPSASASTATAETSPPSPTHRPGISDKLPY